MPARPTRPDDVATYLDRVTDPAKRAALEKLRRDVLAAAPGAVDCIAWSMPSFRLDGRLLVCYAAAKNHCSLYPMSSDLIVDLADDLAKFETTKGSIHFQPDKPLPKALVKKVVRARIAENKAKGKVKGC